MKAYVILAHKYPAQLRRLVKALDDGNSFFFIHIDSNANIAQFDNLQPWQHRVRLLPRERAEWAGFGLVEATLQGIRAACEANLNFSHIILLSGQDYPIRTNTDITRFLDINREKSFIEYHRLPAPARWSNGGLYRVNKYYLGLKPWQKFCSKSLNFLAKPLPFLQRRIYNNLIPYAGSMWWILSMKAARYVVRYTQENPGYTAFHRYTFAADEVFFQTILLNAPGNHVGEIENNDRRYIKWQGMKASHPEILRSCAVKEMLASNSLFARKFDAQIDDEPLNFLDQHRLEQNNMYAPQL